MARLIAVSIDCRNEAARQTFEEIVSRRRDYLITKGQGTGAVDYPPFALYNHERAIEGQTFAGRTSSCSGREFTMDSL